MLKCLISVLEFSKKKKKKIAVNLRNFKQKNMAAS